MKSLSIEEWQIDKVQEYMGSVVIPPHIPMPEPTVKEERDFDKKFFQKVTEPYLYAGKATADEILEVTKRFREILKDKEDRL